ncbi:MAG: hypothetical protein V4476_07250 [Pseudomonadota bacterium]
MRLHVSVEYFQRERLHSLYFTVPAENFSSLLSIYGGHFFDAVFNITGHPDSIDALTVNQFKEVTLIETGAVLPHTLADQVVVSGSFANGAVLTAHLEADKRNNFGWQLELTNLYAAYARDVEDGTHLVPTFADALVMHDLIDKIEASNSNGQRVALK